MKYEHVAVDMDDVVTDFVGGLLECLWREHGVRITEEQLAEAGWDLRPLLDPVVGYNWWTWLREREHLWATFPAVPGAMGALERLRRDGYYLELITSKPRWAEHNVWDWLRKWRPPFQRVTIVDKDDRKVDFTNADILIDDKPENIQGFLDEGRMGLLFSRPHNGTAVLPISADEQEAVRVENWAQVLGFLWLERNRPDGR